MSSSKKYDYKVSQDGEQWACEIIRQVTARKTKVSKKQAGFANEQEAEEWGKTELASFVESLKQKNLRHAKARN